MTAGEVIALADELRPNQYSTARKLQWLRRLDGQILAELLETHGGDSGLGVRGSRSGETDPSRSSNLEAQISQLPDTYTEDTALLAPFPYDEELYTAYLFCQIDLHNAEIQKYNQSLSLLAAAWRQLADFINRRRPCAAARLRF